MITRKALFECLEHSARVYPDRLAIEEPGQGAINYRDLAALSDRLRDRLYHIGVRRGDRVGIFMRKSIDAVASIFGILKAGAAYVPVDPMAPSSRNAYILNDCSVTAVVMEECFAENLRSAAKGPGNAPYLFLLNSTGGGLPLRKALEQEQVKDPAPIAQTQMPSLDDLAYILYTSGSTGKPKGVMISHRNAMSFINWASETFRPNEKDRFSSHAPFHFDLSILDIYVSIKHGATLVLISEELGKDPPRLASLISEKKISIWYSTPSILSLLAQYGKMERYDYSALEKVLFAGEVFPVKHLQALKTLLPGPEYYNLYGPTETNVCTFFEIPVKISEDRTEPFPIGKRCSHYETLVVDERGQEVSTGQEGELCVSGPGVMRGYWNLPEKTNQGFFVDRTRQRWYKTGDIVVEEADGNYTFVGRRDRMVKKRGYRVELGEIETVLYHHPEVKEAAVIALTDPQDGIRLKAFLSCLDGKRLSLVRLKRFCAEKLPIYMVPDQFSFQDFLPKTSTNKIDYQRLNNLD